MKKLLSLFILICFTTLSNAMVFRTMDGKTITGKMKTNESKRLEIETKEGIVFLDKENISVIINDNGEEVTSFIIDSKSDYITESMQKAVTNKNTSNMTDREFAFYLNEQQTKAINKISNTMWEQFCIVLGVSIITGIVVATSSKK
jgi:hypothetical protein